MDDVCQELAATAIAKTLFIENANLTTWDSGGNAAAIRSKCSVRNTVPANSAESGLWQRQ
jgi:hypothetical protein